MDVKYIPVIPECVGFHDIILGLSAMYVLLLNFYDFF
jgi:hypothetical protein